MKVHLSKVLLIAIFLGLWLTACQSAETEEGPADAYWGYYESCENGKYETARNYLDDQAKMQIDAVGVCGLTHDAVNRYVAESGGTERTFSEEPVLEVIEDRAIMSWLDDQGNMALVYLIKMEDGWKVADTIWSD